MNQVKLFGISEKAYKYKAKFAALDSELVILLIVDVTNPFVVLELERVHALLYLHVLTCMHVHLHVLARDSL